MPSGYSWGHFCYENKLKKKFKNIFLFQINPLYLHHQTNKHYQNEKINRLHHRNAQARS